MSEERFDEWAIMDLFGHQKIAGKVSEQQIGGASFVRVDVPLDPPFTTLLGAAAIYSITITDEMTARAAARYWKPEPMDKWTVKDMLRLPGPQTEEE